jgi:hypothetical protein
MKPFCFALFSGLTADSMRKISTIEAPLAWHIIAHGLREALKLSRSMKRTLRFSFIALAITTLLWACGHSSPAKQTGEAFLNAISVGDVETAKKYVTKESESSLSMLKMLAKGKKANPDKIEIGEIEESADKALLHYKENGADRTLNLVKQGSEWKVVWTKGDMPSDPGADDEIQEVEVPMNSGNSPH